MKVLIIGGTGFISGHIARTAAEAGHDVVLFNRGRHPASEFETITGNLNDLTSYKEQLRALAPDVVVHSMALTEKHAKDFADVFENTGAHLIALSSADCYEAFQKLNRGENPGLTPVREDDQLSLTAHYYAAFGMPDYDKNLMTSALLQAHHAGAVNATVFRLPMVYGPGDFQYENRHGDIIKHLLDDKTDMVMGPGEQQQAFTYGYVENMAAAIVHSFGRPEVAGQIYNLGDADTHTRRAWAELYAANAGKEFEFHTPAEDAAPQAFIMDVGKFARHTGFVPPVDTIEAVKRTYDWAKEHPDTLARVQIDYAAEQAVINHNPAPN